MKKPREIDAKKFRTYDAEEPGKSERPMLFYNNEGFPEGQHFKLERIPKKQIDNNVQESFEAQIRTSRIVFLFALIAILISMLGLIAMSTYFIEQRQKEIAVRKVFGSTSAQMRRRLVRTFLIYVMIAFVISVPIVLYFMSDWIIQYTYRITWWPWIAVAGAIILLISFAAVMAQSWRAANENPIKHIKDN